MHNYVAAQGSPRREEMRPLLQGKGRLGTLGARCKEAGELRRAQAPSSSPGHARSHPELRSSLRTAGGAQGCSASKDTWTPEEPGLSHLVGERSARGSRLGQVGAMGSAGWLSLPAYPGTMPPNRLLPKQVLVASHLPTHYPSIHPSICLFTHSFVFLKTHCVFGSPSQPCSHVWKAAFSGPSLLTPATPPPAPTPAQLISPILVVTSAPAPTPSGVLRGPERGVTTWSKSEGRGCAL